MFSNKRLIQQYEARIADLKLQIEDLRRLVLPPKAAPYSIPVVDVEMDAVLSGKDEPIALTDDQANELNAIESEAAKILSGTY